ncbi:MAG: mobile mystery protein B [Bdellovibrionaceae bacterium]|nr:mobile mystery protein B [Pseudobdellovibrionaceae bacterium]
MSNFQIDDPEGATPLDPDEVDGLKLDFIDTQAELNIFEKKNIVAATKWVLSRRDRDCLNVSFCMGLHKRMFGEVWTWAGQQRQTNKNIGVDSSQIAMQLQNLFQNTTYWIEHKTYNMDEICVRFHHKLVFIHAFPNGNGRHARLMTEVLQNKYNQKPFTWGSKEGSYKSDQEIRSAYIVALRAADDGDCKLLLEFCRK